MFMLAAASKYDLSTMFSFKAELCQLLLLGLIGCLPVLLFLLLQSVDLLHRCQLERLWNVVVFVKILLSESATFPRGSVLSNSTYDLSQQ